MEERYFDLQQSHFIQDISDKGYYWDEDAQPELEALGSPYDESIKEKYRPPFLVEAPKTEGYYRKTLLEDRPTLFLEFAELEPTKEAILRFANTYGSLLRVERGIGEVLVSTPLHPKGSPPPLGITVTKDGQEYPIVAAESLSFWRKELSNMKRIVMVWEWWKDKEVEKLAKVIRWQGTGSVAYVLSDKEELLESAWERLKKGEVLLGCEFGHLAANEQRGEKPFRFRPEIFSRFRPGDVLLPAQYLIQLKINRQLEREECTCRPRLLINERNDLEPYIVPTNLLAAMWYQFYQAVVGERIFKRCKTCGIWVDLTGARSDKQKRWKECDTCKNRKKQAKHRKKEKALELAASGLTVTEIAKQLEWPVTEIEEWVKSSTRG